VSPRAVSHDKARRKCAGFSSFSNETFITNSFYTILKRALLYYVLFYYVLLLFMFILSTNALRSLKSSSSLSLA